MERLFASFGNYQIFLSVPLSISFLFLNMLASGFLTFNLPLLSMSSYCQPTISLHKLLPRPGPSLLLLLDFQWSKELARVPGGNHPIVEEDDRPKNSSSSITGVYDCSLWPFPVLVLTSVHQGHWKLSFLPFFLLGSWFADSYSTY